VSHRIPALPLLVLIALLSSCTCDSESVPPAPPYWRAKPNASSAAAATASSSANPKAAAGPPARPFLWRVSDDKGIRGHLFGTVHLSEDPNEILHPTVWRAFDAATTVVMEVDVGAANPSAVLTHAMLPAGETLEQKLTAERWDKLRELTGVPGLMIKNVKPFFAFALMVKKMLPDAQPMDLLLQQRAQKSGKALVYLETVDEQLALLDGAITLDVLADAIDEHEKAKRMLLDLSVAYRKGDVATVTKAAFDPGQMKKHPALFDAVYFQRNARWTPKIKAQLGPGNVFVAVGSGHLIGDKSVVTLLQAEGLEVERVSVAP